MRELEQAQPCNTCATTSLVPVALSFYTDRAIEQSTHKLMCGKCYDL